MRLVIPGPSTVGSHGQTLGRSEGFPARDIWFLGTLEQGSARCPEFLGNRRRRRRRRRRRQDLMDIEVQ